MGALRPKLRAAFHLYVPSGMVDVARRLCEDNQIHVDEIWSYHTVGDEVRFTLVHRSREAARRRAARARSRRTRRPPGAVTSDEGAPRKRRPAQEASSARRSKPQGREEACARRQEAKAQVAVAFLRFSRDKRGYEHFYLVQPTTNGRGRSRQRAALLVPHAA